MVHTGKVSTGIITCWKMKKAAVIGCFWLGHYDNKKLINALCMVFCVKLSLFFKAQKCLKL